MRDADVNADYVAIGWRSTIEPARSERKQDDFAASLWQAAAFDSEGGQNGFSIPACTYGTRLPCNNVICTLCAYVKMTDVAHAVLRNRTRHRGIAKVATGMATKAI